VGEIVGEYAKESAPPDQLASDLLETVLGSLDETERTAFAGQFKYPKLAPLTYIESEAEIDRIERIARCAVTIYKREAAG